ncbi:MAG: hypothetical protein R3A43_02345 [Bacteroidia bacterium]
MEKFKKAFKFQLKWLTILGLLAIIVGILIDELDEPIATKITVEEFTKIIFRRVS